MRTTTRLLAVAIATTLSAVMITPPASAARGTFTFYDNDGGMGIVDPDDDVCYRLGFTIRQLDNATNRYAAVFAKAECGGASVNVLRPRSAAPAPGDAWVRFQRSRSGGAVVVGSKAQCKTGTGTPRTPGRPR
ncbi:hypothetical protein V5P93_003094 [Actinokineospora auranticolor]|nr:hypothetical protein [Actinokineospora auranticolor]